MSDAWARSGPSKTFLTRLSLLISDVDELRRKHRIVGALCGSLPRAVRQNAHLGLPLKLMPEEATLLQEKGKTARFLLSKRVQEMRGKLLFFVM